MRTAVRGVTTAVAGGNKEAAKTSYSQAVPVIDALVSKQIIHRNKAARHKSRLAARNPCNAVRHDERSEPRPASRPDHSESLKLPTGGETQHLLEMMRASPCRSIVLSLPHCIARIRPPGDSCAGRLIAMDDLLAHERVDDRHGLAVAGLGRLFVATGTASSRTHRGAHARTQRHIAGAMLLCLTGSFFGGRCIGHAISVSRPGSQASEGR